jgi:hypothetical protein
MVLPTPPAPPIPYLTLEVDGDNDGNFNESDDLILFQSSTDNQVIVRATVYNSSGGVVSGSTVTFGSDSLEASFPLGSIKTTDGNGEAFVLVQVDPIAIRNLETVLNITAEADNGAFNMVTLFLKPVIIQTINVAANPQTVDSGGTSTITAQVLTNAGTPAPDGTTVNFTTNIGGIDPFSQTTDGIATTEFTAPEVTSDSSATIRASAGSASPDTVIIPIIAPEIPPTPPPALSIVPSSVSVIGATPSDTITFTISGGTAPYTTTSSDLTRAFKDINSNGVLDGVEGGIWTGASIVVTIPAGALSGTATLTVIDSAVGTDAATITVQ